MNKTDDTFKPQEREVTATLTPEKREENRLHQYLLLFGIAAVIIILDQISKYIIRTNLELSESWMPWAWLAPYARIVYWKNTGAAFGLFQNASTLLAIMAVLISAAVILYYPQIPRKEKLMRFALGMMLGGALGNLIDRLTIGYVIDFISVGTFPVFNVADSCITVGVGLLMLGMWISENKAKKEANRTAANASVEMTGFEITETIDPVKLEEKQDR